MRKIIGILMALCILTVLVSSASAWCYGKDCTNTLDPVKVKTSNTPVQGFLYQSNAYAEGGVNADSTPTFFGYTCPSGSWQAGTTPTTGGGTLAYGSASAAGGATAGSAGSSETNVVGLGF